MNYQKEYNALMQQHIILQNEHDELKKEQEDFQNALIAKVEEIERSPKMWRWLRYGKLLFSLIETIKEAYAKVRNKNK